MSKYNTIRNLTEVKENPELDVDILTEVDLGWQLVVHNDDVNTFEWVIESLVDICRHTSEQAEQCAYFIHFKGKYAVKHGTETELIPMKEALLDRGITATIESNA
ncbi:MAG: ATP-dependent Clp protease adaptor ClpS [Sphingobacteriales bacterium]|jgi:ATP-dependent Clp protease adaptor protein ClpS|nr:MAG: ATP-dependent Clp protease adaptor ClpS [Sphingobacteriales bacterium]